MFTFLALYSTRSSEGKANVETGIGALAYGTSLPITIPKGCFWPPREARDSYDSKARGSDEENASRKVKTVSFIFF